MITVEQPCLTGDLPGIGGRLKAEPQDFVVEEIPAFKPSGEGEHLYLWVEKRGVAHEQLVRHIATSLGISRSDVGTAGMKDRQAITLQYVSVPVKPQAAIDAIDNDDIQVHSVTPHRHKLKTGKLQGNRFTILVREVVDNADEIAEQIAGRIRRHGCPNYFGSQRFGTNNETLQTGFELLRGEKKPKDLPAARRRFLLRLSLSAVQSYLFNAALAQRMNDGLISTVLPGDVMQVVQSGGLFVVEDVPAEQLRFDNHETAITGPLFGPKTRQPQGDVLARESRLLEEHGFDMSAWQQYRKLTPGTRRPCCVMPAALAIATLPDGLQFCFSLPAGSYATVLMREFMKVEASR